MASRKFSEGKGSCLRGRLEGCGEGGENLHTPSRPAKEPPVFELCEQDVEKSTDELVSYHGQFADLFFRKEQAHWGLRYLQGLLLPHHKEEC